MAHPQNVLDPTRRERARRPQRPDATAKAGPPGAGIVIGRYQGTVVVTVHGELCGYGAAHLGLMLADLIDGQGNLSLIVDLHDATVSAGDSDHVSVFADAARRARRRGGALTLGEPPAVLRADLRRRGLDYLVGAAYDPGVEAARRRERCAHPAGRSVANPTGGHS